MELKVFVFGVLVALIKRLISSKFVVLVILAVTILVSYFSYLYYADKLSETSINLNIDVDGDNVILEATDSDGDICCADIYKNGNLFYRLYSPSDDKPENGVVTFIFDDGWLDVYTHACPVFSKYQVPASVAVISSYVDNPGALSTRQLHRLTDSGWDLLAHATGDTPLTELDRQGQIDELVLSQAFLWQNFWGAQSFVFPFGKYDQDIINLTERHYIAGRGYSNGINQIPLDPFNLKILSLENTTTPEKIEDAIVAASTQSASLIIVGHHVHDEQSDMYTVHPNLIESSIKFALGQGMDIITFGQLIQKYASLSDHAISGNAIHWEFKKYLLESDSVFQVQIDGRKSNKVSL